MDPFSMLDFDALDHRNFNYDLTMTPLAFRQHLRRALRQQVMYLGVAVFRDRHCHRPHRHFTLEDCETLRRYVRKALVHVDYILGIRWFLKWRDGSELEMVPREATSISFILARLIHTTGFEGDDVPGAIGEAFCAVRMLGFYARRSDCGVRLDYPSYDRGGTMAQYLSLDPDAQTGTQLTNELIAELAGHPIPSLPVPATIPGLGYTDGGVEEEEDERIRWVISLGPQPEAIDVDAVYGPCEGPTEVEEGEMAMDCEVHTDTESEESHQTGTANENGTSGSESEVEDGEISEDTELYSQGEETAMLETGGETRSNTLPGATTNHAQGYYPHLDAFYTQAVEAGLYEVADGEQASRTRMTYVEAGVREEMRILAESLK